MVASRASLRRAERTDSRALSDLAQRTFVETFVEDFAIPYSAADLAEFTPRALSAEAFERRIAEPGAGVWIADVDGAAAGFAVADACALPHPEASGADGELKQLYVLRSAQGLGVGRSLLDAALAWLAQDGERRVWIGVWSGNTRAQAVYAARGFAKVGEYDFRVGETVDREFILRREPGMMRP